jgi:nucleotidyltransferase/DNA polymerase involved in DNA repair
MKDSILKELRRIPGVGKEISEDLWNIGIRSVQDLKGHDPERLYQKLCEFEGTKIDRCMLYVLRCAVYYASNIEHDPRLLKWWNWKDEKIYEP